MVDYGSGTIILNMLLMLTELQYIVVSILGFEFLGALQSKEHVLISILKPFFWGVL